LIFILIGSDRWGNTVYLAREMPIAWDGAMNQSALNPGVFVYTITVKKQDGTSDILSGDVTLVK